MTFQEGLDQIGLATQKIVEANQLVSSAIMNAFLFTWQWWIALALFVVPWVIWVLFRNRESSARIFSAGLLVMVLSEILDNVGVGFGKWEYPIKILPVTTLNISVRLATLPVFVMLLLQYKPKFNPFLKAIFFGGFGAYVAMPILSMIHLYKKIDWAYTYSFLILTCIYLVAHWFIRINSFQRIQVQGDKTDREFAFNLSRKKDKIR